MFMHTYQNWHEIQVKWKSSNLEKKKKDNNNNNKRQENTI